MKNIFARLVLFMVAVPALFSVIFFLPYRNHLVLNILVIIFSTIGALEFSGILGRRGICLRKAEALVFGFLPPFSATLYVSFGWTPFGIPLVIIICAAYSLISCALAGESRLVNVTPKIAGTFSVLLYPGVFLCPIIFLGGTPDGYAGAFSSGIENSKVLILTMFSIVFANDAAAWLFGSLFGRKNNRIFAASPNKSIAGFVSGFLASIGIGIIAALLLPASFTIAKFSAIPSGLILGCTTGIAASLGDLAESAIKRSSGVKDSGKIMLGRGGVLDCIDSVSLAAPVFFVVYNILFIIP